MGGGGEEGVVCYGGRSITMHDVWFASCKREGVACVLCDCVEIKDSGLAKCGAAAVVTGNCKRVTLTNVHTDACLAGVLVYDSTAALDFVSAKGFSLCGMGCFNGSRVQVRASHCRRRLCRLSLTAGY